MYIFLKKRHRPPVFKQTEGQYIFILYPYFAMIRDHHFMFIFDNRVLRTSL